MNNLGDRGPGEPVFRRSRSNQSGSVLFPDFSDTKPDATFNDDQTAQDEARKAAIEKLKQRLNEEKQNKNSAFYDIPVKKVEEGETGVPKGTQETLGSGPVKKGVDVVGEIVIDNYRKTLRPKFSVAKPATVEPKPVTGHEEAMNMAKDALRKNTVVQDVLRKQPPVSKEAKVPVQENIVPEIKQEENKTVHRPSSHFGNATSLVGLTEKEKEAKRQSILMRLEEARRAQKTKVAQATETVLGGSLENKATTSPSLVRSVLRPVNQNNTEVVKETKVHAEQVEKKDVAIPSAASPLMESLLARQTKDLASALADHTAQEALKKETKDVLRDAEYIAVKEKFAQEFSKEKSLEKKKEVLEKLAKRSREAYEKLSKFGLENLDAYKALGVKEKLLVGVAFGGLSIATGGATSLLSKTLSTASFSRGFYESMLKAEKENGNDGINKGLLAARAVAYGAVAAIGGGEIVQELLNHVPEDLTETVKSKLSFLRDGIKDFFGVKHDVINPVVRGVVTPSPLPPLSETPLQTESVIAQSEIVEPHAQTPPIAASPEITEPVTPSFTPDYIIKEGDDLTKIITREVLPYSKGVELLADSQKENVIQNLLSHAKHNADGTLSELGKLLDQNLIRSGAHLNLEEIRQALESIKLDVFGGKTFVEHALTLDPATISENIKVDTGVTVNHIVANQVENVPRQAFTTTLPLQETADTLVTVAASPVSLDVYSPYVLKEGDTATSLFKRVLITIPESSSLSMDEQDALIGRLIKEYSSWYNRWTATGGIIKDINGGVGTEIRSLNRVRDVLAEALQKSK